MDTPIRVAVIIGSTREGRFGPTVAQWFAGQAAPRADIVVDVVDLAAMDLPAAYPKNFGPEVQAYLARLDEADAFVVVTPEYNHSFPAALKQAIDLGKREWQAKPVAFVSYGGMSGGLRAVEHLRQVFAELHAVTMRDTVSFHNFRQQFDQAGQPIDAAGTGAAVKKMLDQLTWWAVALRNARAQRPYAA
jgi:NAD(P)H-dependent FMN reductase